MLLTCEKCKNWGHDQDQLHGKGVRVHNQMKDPTKARCTVCGNIRDTGKSQPVIVAKESEA